jgi:arylsulfatase A-like enzyme
MGAALGEGAVAAAMAAQMGLTVGLAALACLWGAALMLAPAALGGAALAWVLHAAGPRRLGRALQSSLGGGEPGHAGTAAVLVVLALAGGVLGGAWAGDRLIAHLRADFAAAAVAGVSVLLAGALLGVAAAVAPAVAKGWLGAERRLGRVGALLSPASVAAFAAVALIAALVWWLPVEFAVAPGGAALAMAASLSRRLRGTVARLRRRWWPAFALVALAFASWPLLHLAPPPVRQVLGTAVPYTSLGLGAAAQVFDRDGDGHAAPPFGHDCDDTDASIHPGAIDIPADGIDQSCSGADARAYELPKPPPWWRPTQLPERSNVVLIVLDALRVDRTGFAGNDRALTPHLDRFRRSSTWFRWAYAPSPRTSFSLSSVLTGRYLQGLPVRKDAGNRFVLEPGAQTVASRLQKAGYDTVAFTLPYLFHHTEGIGAGFRVWESPWPVDEWREHFGKSDPITTQASIAYLRTVPEDGRRPFFLLAHYHCAHEPYVRHAEWDFGPSRADRYDSSVAQCDHHVGRLLEALDARADADRTAVLVMADHGELLGEHGFTAHGRTLFEPEVRVPLLLRLPGPRPQPTVHRPVVLTDVAPTLLDLAGITPPRSMQGWSLLSQLYPAQEPFPERAVFLYTQMRRGSAVYEGQGLLVHPLKYVRDVRSGAVELYDVVADPAEAHNLAAERSADSHRLGVMLEALHAHLASP